jgi:hypothetical protein
MEEDAPEAAAPAVPVPAKGKKPTSAPAAPSVTPPKGADPWAVDLSAPLRPDEVLPSIQSYPHKTVAKEAPPLPAKPAKDAKEGKEGKERRHHEHKHRSRDAPADAKDDGKHHRSSHRSGKTESKPAAKPAAAPSGAGLLIDLGFDAPAPVAAAPAKVCLSYFSFSLLVCRSSL